MIKAKLLNVLKKLKLLLTIIGGYLSKIIGAWFMIKFVKETEAIKALMLI